MSALVQNMISLALTVAGVALRTAMPTATVTGLDASAAYQVIAWLGSVSNIVVTAVHLRNYMASRGASQA